jgi:hypothetical protein
MALKSGITAEDHRFGLQADIASAGALRARTGLFPNGSNPANLVGVTALQAKITPFQAFIAGTYADTQAGYRVTSDTDVVLTFDPGSGTNPRIDLVVARVRDDPYDGSGFQNATVEIIFGVPAVSPQVPAVPLSCLPLWQVTVPANASGAIPIDFTTARVDRRVYTAASGGLINVASQAERDGIASPHIGMSVWRADRTWVETYDGAVWRVQGVPAVPTYNDLTLITNPAPGMVAVSTADNVPWMYTTLLGPGLWISPLLAIFPTGFGAWAPWTPVLAQDSVVAATVNSATYQRVGNMVAMQAQVTVTGTGSANRAVVLTLPAPAVGIVTGNMVLWDASANTYYTAVLVGVNATSVAGYGPSSTAQIGVIGGGFTAALTTGDTVTVSATYEAA